MWHFIILKVFSYIILCHRIIDPVSLKEPQYASNLTVIPLKILMNRASSLFLHTPRDKELTTPMTQSVQCQVAQTLGKICPAMDRDVGPLSPPPHWDAPVKICSIFCKMVLWKDVFSKTFFPSTSDPTFPFIPFLNICHQGVSPMLSLQLTFG